MAQSYQEDLFALYPLARQWVTYEMTIRRMSEGAHVRVHPDELHLRLKNMELAETNVSDLEATLLDEMGVKPSSPDAESVIDGFRRTIAPLVRAEVTHLLEYLSLASPIPPGVTAIDLVTRTASDRPERCTFSDLGEPALVGAMRESLSGDSRVIDAIGPPKSGSPGHLLLWATAGGHLLMEERTKVPAPSTVSATRSAVRCIDFINDPEPKALVPQLGTERAAPSVLDRLDPKPFSTIGGATVTDVSAQTRVAGVSLRVTPNTESPAWVPAPHAVHPARDLGDGAGRPGLRAPGIHRPGGLAG